MMKYSLYLHSFPFIFDLVYETRCEKLICIRKSNSQRINTVSQIRGTSSNKQKFASLH